MEKNADLLNVGTAVGSGVALAGRLGSNDPSDHHPIGEVINIAARLQGEARSARCSGLRKRITLSGKTSHLAWRKAV